MFCLVCARKLRFNRGPSLFCWNRSLVEINRNIHSKYYCEALEAALLFQANNSYGHRWTCIPFLFTVWDAFLTGGSSSAHSNCYKNCLIFSCVIFELYFSRIVLRSPSHRSSTRWRVSYEDVNVALFLSGKRESSLDIAIILKTQKK